MGIESDVDGMVRVSAEGFRAVNDLLDAGEVASGEDVREYYRLDRLD